MQNRGYRADLINDIQRCTGCTGCSYAASQSTISEPSRQNFKPMTKLVIETLDGKTYSIKVKRADKNGIQSRDGEYIPFSNIKSIEKLDCSPTEVLLANGIVVTVFISVMLLAVSQNGVGIGLGQGGFR